MFARFPLRVVLASLAAVPAAPQRLRDRMLRWISAGAHVDDEPIARVISAAMREYRIATPPPAYPRDDALRGLRVPTPALIAGRSHVHDPRRALRRTRLPPDVAGELWPEASTRSRAGSPAR